MGLVDDNTPDRHIRKGKKKRGFPLKRKEAAQWKRPNRGKGEV